MTEDDENSSGRRINISVEILEERLKNWAADVKKSQDAVLAEIRHMTDRYDNQVGSLELWRVGHEVLFHTAQSDIVQLKVDVLSLQEAKRVLEEVARLKIAVLDLQEKRKETQVASDAKISLLKLQWTWLTAGALGATALLGLAAALGVSFGF